MTEETREVNGTMVVRRENEHGVMKGFVQVAVGTTVIECRRYQKNPITERRHDMTKLSDDGYLKPFLAVLTKLHQNTIDLEEAPVLSFDKERWEVENGEKRVTLRKREPESQFGEAVLGGDEDGS